jgi:uncharacterized protein YndB with AHSA1/START domain
MIRRQVVVPVSPERLWEALTSPDQVAGWFGARVEWDLQEGGVASFQADDGSERLGRIESVRPGRHLRFVWWPAAGPAEDGSEVSYLLEPLDEGTRLTIQERQLPSPESSVPQASANRMAPPADTGMTWTPWDGRLAGAWARLGSSAVATSRW